MKPQFTLIIEVRRQGEPGIIQLTKIFVARQKSRETEISEYEELEEMVNRGNGRKFYEK